jgi:hypothetical protein
MLLRALGSLAAIRESGLSLYPFLRREYAITSYDVETFCSLSTVFRTVGRCIIRSCHAV